MATLLLGSVLSACSLPAVSSPPVPSGTTAQPASSTEMSLPATPASTKSIGTPVPGWENIPIMSGAYNGELEDMVYLYSVQETVDRVEEYYQTKMSVNGWTLTSRQTLETGSSSGPSTVLNFQKNDQFLNVMLVNVPDENATAVILSQLSP